MPTETILIADDDASMRAMLREFLADEGYETIEVETGSAVESAISEQNPALVLMDIRLPDKSGLDVLKELKGPQKPVIVMTAFGGSGVAIEAMRLGAYDYITKPFDLDDVSQVLKRYFDHRQLTQHVAELSEAITRNDPSDPLVGNSPAMQEVYKQIGRVAASDATVLITGETGTGKELIASILHRTSRYSRGRLVKVNCAALPESLLESELFGHEKGAFTGAVAQRKGRFELADKGTIFLDEIGEMTLATQKKLLRVLQEREFERVGGQLTVKVDTRVIAATNKILTQEVEAGRFREDLYYRLNVIDIYLPPLREREGDIPLLVEALIDRHRSNPGTTPIRISKGALEKLETYSWPGNVRELENVVQRALVLAQGGVISEQHISFAGTDGRRLIDIGERVRRGVDLPEMLADIERTAIEEALDIAGGDRKEAASLLTISLTEFNKRAKTFDL
ncbi:MAG: sigma-54 dependent transcriptional regulator [Thermomicrobiales bacterium]|nr:sigma-54 dependent transcriptional regulator [Thermomicrobiales bacterium]